MGKSPGKWIKTFLFGKKSARSHGMKGRDVLKLKNDKGHMDGKVPPVESPEVSEPVLLSSDRNEIMPPIDARLHPNVTGNAAVISPNKDGGQGVAKYFSSTDASCMSEEHAAIKAQAAFRGYLARKAFRALKGIIRLQALGRGHLVRRQAVATLYAMDGILKLQDFIRGRRLKCSNFGIEESMSFGPFKHKFLTNLFISKLLSSSILATGLQIQYAEGEPNSVVSWLERWTLTGFWKTPSPQPKKSDDSKLQIRKINYAMETESGKSKRNIRRNSTVNDDSTHIATSDSEKVKLSLRKLSSSTIDSVQEHPQSELEKVKHNLRKISKMREASERSDVETEKNDQSFRKLLSTSSDIPDDGFDEPEEQVTNTGVLFPDLDIENETISNFLEVEEPINLLSNDQSLNELIPLQQIENEQNTIEVNRDLSPKGEQVFHEANRNRRRSSSAKLEYNENGSPNTAAIPSYMAATESVKARLRGQISPRFTPDSAEKSGFARRHSLPSTNVKLSSHSPRTQRVAQASSRAGIRSDKSLFPSRDRNERQIQVEWRR